MNFDHGQTVIEIFPKGSFCDSGTQVLVGRRNDTNVDLAWGQRSNALNFLVLKDTQEFGLCRERHVADLIEKRVPPLACSTRPTLSRSAP